LKSARLFAKCGTRPQRDQNNLAFAHFFVVANDRLKGAGCDVVVSLVEDKTGKIPVNLESLGYFLFVGFTVIAAAHGLHHFEVYARVVFIKSKRAGKDLS
jgi:hypothetical protein